MKKRIVMKGKLFNLHKDEECMKLDRGNFQMKIPNRLLQKDLDADKTFSLGKFARKIQNFNNTKGKR